jgi:hypothetical protein
LNEVDRFENYLLNDHDGHTLSMIRILYRYYVNTKTNQILTDNLDRGKYSLAIDSSKFSYKTLDDMLIALAHEIFAAQPEIKTKIFKVIYSGMEGHDVGHTIDNQNIDEYIL